MDSTNSMGFFKKIVIADNCAKYVIIIFNNSGD